MHKRRWAGRNQGINLSKTALFDPLHPVKPFNRFHPKQSRNNLQTTRG